MTKDNWINIALIIASFIAQLAAPTIAGVVTSRKNQPSPTPGANQPKGFIHIASRFVSRWYWVGFIVGFPLNIISLLRTIRDPAPLNAIRVFAIALGTAVIVGMLLSAIFFHLLLKVFDVLMKQMTINEAFLGWFKELSNVIKLIATTDSPKPPQGAVDKLLERVQRHLGL